MCKQLTIKSDWKVLCLNDTFNDYDDKQANEEYTANDTWINYCFIGWYIPENKIIYCDKN